MRPYCNSNILLIVLLIPSCIPAKEPLDASLLDGNWKGSTQCTSKMEYELRINGHASGEVIASVLVTSNLLNSASSIPLIFRGYYFEDRSFELTQEPFESTSKTKAAQTIVAFLNENRMVLKGVLSENEKELLLRAPGPACKPFTAYKNG